MVPVGTGRAQGGLTHTAPVRNGFPAFVGAVGVPTVLTVGGAILIRLCRDPARTN